MSANPTWTFDVPGKGHVFVQYDRINAIDQSWPILNDRRVYYIITTVRGSGASPNGDELRFYITENGVRREYERKTIYEVGGQGQVQLDFYSVQELQLTWEYWTGTGEGPFPSVLETDYDHGTAHPIFVTFDPDDDGDPDNPGTGGSGSGSTGSGGLIPTGFANSGDLGGLLASQSSMRQWFVRGGKGTSLTEASTTTVPVTTPVKTVEHTAIGPVDGQDWEAFKAARAHYSAGFGTTTAFSSSTPGLTYPDNVGSSPYTWYPLAYTVNVSPPAVGVAGTATVSVNVVTDRQEYRRSTMILAGPPDNPYMRPRTEADGPGPINSAVYPHGVRFYVQYWASNAAKSRSNGSNQMQTGIIQLPRIVDPGANPPTYPTSWSFDLPANWWGLEITNSAHPEGEAYARDPQNGLPLTQGSNGSINWYGQTDSHFMGTPPSFTYTETTGGEPTGSKEETIPASFASFGDGGDVASFQSSFKQQLVRVGGAVDLGGGSGGGGGTSSGSGTVSSSYSGSSGLPTPGGGGDGVTPGNYWEFPNAAGGTFRIYHDHYEMLDASDFRPALWWIRVVGRPTGSLYVDYGIYFSKKGVIDPPLDITVTLESGMNAIRFRDIGTAGKGSWAYLQSGSTDTDYVRALPGSRTRYDTGLQRVPDFNAPREE